VLGDGLEESPAKVIWEPVLIPAPVGIEGRKAEESLSYERKE